MAFCREDELTWWAEKIEQMWVRADELLDEAVHQLLSLGLGPAVSLRGRRFLLARGRSSVKDATVLEAHLAPTVDAGFPLFVAAHVRFHDLVPRAIACGGFLVDPPLETLLAPDSPLEPRTIVFSGSILPGIVLAEAHLRAWPLLEIEDAESVRSKVTQMIAAWLDAPGQTPR